MILSLRIAVADDEDDMRDFYRRMLSALGHRVVGVAANGRELIEQCRTERPDLVISDVLMPEVDGIAAAAEICRAAPVPVIFVSARYNDDLAHRAEHDPATSFLVKPIGRRELEAAIAAACRRLNERRPSPTAP
jgi:response regulator NasT